MKIVSITARYLLGLLFTVFGLNGFLHFIHQPPPSDPLALQFLVAVSASHFARRCPTEASWAAAGTPARFEGEHSL